MGNVVGEDGEVLSLCIVDEEFRHLADHLDNHLVAASGLLLEGESEG